MIKIENLTKIYKMGSTEVQALRGVSLEIESGDFVAIMGPSGSGKSTLTQILGLLDTPTSGNYSLRGKEVSQLSEDELAILRRGEIGFIFQQFHLLSRMSAAENVTLPLLYSERNFDIPRAGDFLTRVGLSDRTEHHPNELSGGQQQRVAIARSLINHPQMVIADEPTGNLDSHSEKEILAILEDLNRRGITILIVTHEENIGKHAKRLIRMRDGMIVSDERLSPLPKQKIQLPPRETRTPGGFLGEYFEHFRQGYKTLLANKVRTGLSMLGILIGVAAVIAMLALGRGAQKAIETQLASLGSNLLVLRPGNFRMGGVSQGAGAVTRLSLEDGQAIQSQVAGVKSVAPRIYGRGQVTYLNKNTNTQVFGVSPPYARIHASEPILGRFFTEEENRSRMRVAVIGMTVVRDIFGETNPMGEWIKINRISFQVIGILPEKGANGFQDQDDVIVIPVLTAMHRLFGKNYVDSFDIEATDPKVISSVEDSTLELMNTRKRVPVSQREDAFSIRNMADIQEALSESSKTMAALLASIAAISLLVGGIGIMNIMLVSVTERTREVGLRKAIGARKNDILIQFLFEAVVVSGAGGILGVTLGWTITTVLTSVTGWATLISTQSVILAVLFSATIGIVFGIYPARKASHLNPIEALRHE